MKIKKMMGKRPPGSPPLDAAFSPVMRGGLVAPELRPIVLGHDLAWGGWGWCLADSTGPIECGHLVLGRRRWRWEALLHELEILDARISSRIQERPIRVVIEEPPIRTSSKGKGRKTNDAQAVAGQARLIGAVMLWGTRPGVWLSPWEVPVRQQRDRSRQPVGPPGWRDWWAIPTLRSREAYKLAALLQVDRAGWGAWLEDYGWGEHARRDVGEGERVAMGPAGDVAEAILLAVGAARHEADAPAGPKL